MSAGDDGCDASAVFDEGAWGDVFDPVCTGGFFVFDDFGSGGVEADFPVEVFVSGWWLGWELCESLIGEGVEVTVEGEVVVDSEFVVFTVGCGGDDEVDGGGAPGGKEVGEAFCLYPHVGVFCDVAVECDPCVAPVEGCGVPFCGVFVPGSDSDEGEDHDASVCGCAVGVGGGAVGVDEVGEFGDGLLLGEVFAVGGGGCGEFVEGDSAVDEVAG